MLRSNFHSVIIIIFLRAIIIINRQQVVSSQLREGDRVAEYKARGHNWPPKVDDFIPNTEGWRRVITRRLLQIDRLVDTNNKYNALVNCVHSGLVAPNFTEYGWGLTRAPQDLVNELRKSFHKGLVNDVSSSIENDVRGQESESGDANNNDNLKPLFLKESYELKQKALKVVKPILESWADTNLVANNAYGYRVYRQGNIMNMHLDNSHTHIISCILHVDHDPMSQPWPIILEDYHGNTIEVMLESGDMLLYESSKVYHGRPKPFQGSWYTSLFLHYYPTDWNAQKIVYDTHYRIPPTWHPRHHVNPTQEGLEKLVAVGNSYKEPDCEYQWCSLNETTVYSGPAMFGFVLTPSGQHSLRMNEVNDRTSEL